MECFMGRALKIEGVIVQLMRVISFLYMEMDTIMKLYDNICEKSTDYMRRKMENNENQNLITKRNILQVSAYQLSVRFT